MSNHSNRLPDSTDVKNVVSATERSDGEYVNQGHIELMTGLRSLKSKLQKYPENK